MSKALQKKISSQSGASIAMALLLFMVCAILGAIVLSAATAAAGRMSGLADDDQRYYSVASAAELVSQQLCDNPVVIKREQINTNTVTREYKYTSSGAVELIGSNTVNDSAFHTTIGKLDPITDKDCVIDTSSMSLLSAEAVRLIFGEKKCNTPGAMTDSFTGGTTASAKGFTLSQSSSDIVGDALTALNVAGSFAGQSDGTLLVTLWNTSGSETFKLTIKLTPGFSETVFPSTTTVPTVTKTADGYIEKAVTTDIVQKITTVTWSVDSID